jgi:hypothetical protein
MTAYSGQILTRLSQLCASLWGSQSQPVVIEPRIEPGSVVMPLALRCSAVDHCTTREGQGTQKGKGACEYILYSLHDKLVQYACIIDMNVCTSGSMESPEGFNSAGCSLYCTSRNPIVKYINNMNNSFHKCQICA